MAMNWPLILGNCCLTMEVATRVVDQKCSRFWNEYINQIVDPFVLTTISRWSSLGKGAFKFKKHTLFETILMKRMTIDWRFCFDSHTRRDTYIAGIPILDRSTWSRWSHYRDLQDTLQYGIANIQVLEEPSRSQYGLLRLVVVKARQYIPYTWFSEYFENRAKKYRGWDVPAYCAHRPLHSSSSSVDV